MFIVQPSNFICSGFEGWLQLKFINGAVVVKIIALIMFLQ